MPTMTAAMRRTARDIALGIAAASILILPLARELRLTRATQSLTDRWRDIPITPRGSTLLGISFRSPQVEAYGLEPRSTLQELLAHPFQLIRLGAYWNRIEPTPGSFDPREIDWQIEAAERAEKQIILCVGALKTFGYPEFFVPPHHLAHPLQEHSLVTSASHPTLLAAATEFITRVVDRYKGLPSVVAWQVEHEAIDPLGLEHSWRLATAFVEQEVQTVRHADPTRPILMNGFLPAVLPGKLAQWWQTRDQGDSLALADQLADIVGVDYYPRYALATIGPLSVYLDGTKSPWARQGLKQLLAGARAGHPKIMITEGQAEPWETVTIAPNPQRKGTYSCLPEQLITNYNAAMGWSREDTPLYAYLFWGAEYWLLRQQSHDLSYVRAFARILDQS